MLCPVKGGSALCRESPFVIVLTPGERIELEARVRRYTSPYCDAVRDNIVLLSTEGFGNDAIAARVDLPRQVVSKQRQHFYRHRLGVLEAEPRGGGPACFSPRCRGCDQTELVGRCGACTGKAPFDQLAKDVMDREP